ncbi:MAG: 50S ribosomal protein L4 [Pseudomonadota bacterium]|nr:50S ribosomal protein L4 [Pseudomonadota bacterium]
MEIQALKQNGSKGSKLTLSDKVFSQPFNEDLVHQLITTYIFNSHQRTKEQKNRSRVRGGGRKPWKQKGTGRARAGTIRSPLWRGGGVTFAKEYTKRTNKKINKKMYRAAMRSIWSRLAKEDRILALDDLQIESPPKSSQIKTILSDLGISNAVFVVSKKDEVLNLATRNFSNLKVQTLSSLNPSALVNAEKVVITSETVPSLEERFL